MSRSTDDLGLQQPSVPVGGANGVEGLLITLKKSTVEVKNLLMNECDILYECRYCKNIFRSSINYVTHKRVYCRALHTTIAPAFSAVALDFAQNAISGSQSNEQIAKQETSFQQPSKAEAASALGTKIELQQPKRAKGILKRTNLISVLNKHTEHYALSLPNSEHKLDLHTLPRVSRDVPTTTFRDGQQIIESFPHALVTKDKIPSNRVPVVMPQDNSSRYREMNLRNRKGDSSKNGVARSVGPEEIEILERMGKYRTMLLDLSTLTCSHSDCKEKLPFSSLFTLAYHLTVKHNRRAAPNKLIPCYLCDFDSQSYATLIEHLKTQHEQYYVEHATARSAVEDLKRGRKGKQAKAAPVRGRSLSPLSDDFVESEESADGSDENGSDAAPILELMANIEAVNEELKLNDDKDAKGEMEAKICGDSTNEDDNVRFAGFQIIITRVSEIKWAVKNRMDYMVAAVSGEIEKAQMLDGTEFELNTDVTLDTSSKLQQRSKGRPRNAEGKSAQGKIASMNLKKRRHIPPVWLRTSRKNTSNVSQTSIIETVKEEVTQESDEDAKQEGEVEAELPKKRGRGRKPKAKLERQPKGDVEKDEFSGNSDEAEDGRKQRPSRHRRKPNWIDENFVTGFKSKRARRNEMDDEDPEYDYQSQKGQNLTVAARLSSSTASKGIKSADSSQRSSPANSIDTKVGLKSEASSGETSNSSTPGRQQSPYATATTSYELGDCVTRPDLHMSTLCSVVHPSSDSENASKDAVNKKTCRLQYTPRARRMKYGDDFSASNADEEEGPSTSAKNPNASSGGSGANTFGDRRSAPQSRRKQDLSTIRENNDEVMIVRYSNGEASLPKDLSEIPVYLTETQRDLFFSFIRPASPSSDGATSAHKCMQCGDIIANISEGRRHAVSHLRIMRLRCSLCGCGSFFCSDMRTHLQYRHCENLHLAPKGYVAPGNIVPCMSQRQADDLTKVVDPMKPGRVMYTSGKIISSTNPKPYYPDPVIEGRVLGSLLPEINSHLNQEHCNFSATSGGTSTGRQD